ncbi:VOC family protein [Ramlibacter henchirensis]|nr:VOC family protein [Ramlibacter henchirensis]
MIRKLTEIGIAVADLDAAVELLRRTLGASPGPVQRFEDYGMEFCLCRVADIDFEVMAPCGDGDILNPFLERFGQGLHQIAFHVDDVAATQANVIGSGLEFLDAEPRIQHFLLRHGISCDVKEAQCSFAFTRPASILGTLFEFIQYPPGFDTFAASANLRRKNDDYSCGVCRPKLVLRARGVCRRTCHQERAPQVVQSRRPP